MDRSIGTIYQALINRGLTPSTAIIITAKHGQQVSSCRHAWRPAPTWCCLATRIDISATHQQQADCSALHVACQSSVSASSSSAGADLLLVHTRLVVWLLQTPLVTGWHLSSLPSPVLSVAPLLARQAQRALCSHVYIHALQPIFPNATLVSPTPLAAALASANISVAQFTTDDIGLIWLDQQNQTTAAINTLRGLASNQSYGIQAVNTAGYYGEQHSGV